MKIDASNWRLETAWPEEESGYVVAAFYDGPQRECCSLPLCKAEGWIVKPSEDEISAAELGSFIIRACNSHDALVAAAKDCADSLEIEIEARYPLKYRQVVPTEQRRYDRDMQPVRDVRAALALAKGEK